MIKKFLIFLFVFGLLPRATSPIFASDPYVSKPKIIPLPSGIFNTPTPTPTAAPTATPTVTPEPTSALEPTIVSTQSALTSPTPQPTPTPEASSLPTPTISFNIWQLTTIALAAAIIGGGIALVFGKKRPPISQIKKEREENK